MPRGIGYGRRRRVVRRRRPVRRRKSFSRGRRGGVRPMRIGFRM